ncbi:hypothetical protein, partial [Vibrio echinoideorum]
EDLNIDLGKPIVYALPIRSRVDLLPQQKHALELGLPDTLSKLEISVKSLQRYVVISSRKTLLQDEDYEPIS